MWTALREVVAQGATILLTTQYLEEADRLADHIAMLKAGRVIAQGSPEALKAALGGDWIDMVFTDATALAAATPQVQPFAVGAINVDTENYRLSIPVAQRTKTLINVINALVAQGIEPADISLRRPTLDEVFLHLTSAETDAEVVA